MIEDRGSQMMASPLTSIPLSSYLLSLDHI